MCVCILNLREVFFSNCLHELPVLGGLKVVQRPKMPLKYVFPVFPKVDTSYCFFFWSVASKANLLFEEDFVFL